MLIFTPMRCSRVRLLLYEHKEQKKGNQGKGRKFYCSNGCHRACSIFSSNLHEYRPLQDIVTADSPHVSHTASSQPDATSPAFPTPTRSARLPPSAARTAAINAAAAEVAADSASSVAAARALSRDSTADGHIREVGNGQRVHNPPNANATAVLVDGIWR